MLLAYYRERLENATQLVRVAYWGSLRDWKEGAASTKVRLGKQLVLMLASKQLLLMYASKRCEEWFSAASASVLSLLSPPQRQHLYSVYLLYWYKSTNTDAI